MWLNEKFWRRKNGTVLGIHKPEDWTPEDRKEAEAERAELVAAATRITPIKTGNVSPETANALTKPPGDITAERSRCVAIIEFASLQQTIDTDSICRMIRAGIPIEEAKAQLEALQGDTRLQPNQSDMKKANSPLIINALERKEKFEETRKGVINSLIDNAKKRAAGMV